MSPKRQHLGLYLRFQPKRFRAAEVADSLRALWRHLRGQVVLLWDRGSIHTGAAIEAVRKAHPRLHVEEFPAYAPELNPTAEEMASLLYDMEHRNRLEASTPQDVWRHLVGDERGVGESFHPALGKGVLDTLGIWVDYIGKDLPYTVAKLSTKQRQWCQQFIRAKMEDLIEAFDGRGPWTK